MVPTLFSRDSKKFWDSLGVTLVTWTVNDAAEKQFFLKSLKVPIITDGLNDPLQLS